MKLHSERISSSLLQGASIIGDWFVLHKRHLAASPGQQYDHDRTTISG